MNIYWSLTTLFKRLNWQLDESASKIAEISSNICYRIENINVSERAYHNTAFLPYDDVESLKRIVTRILKKDEQDNELYRGFQSACNSFLYYQSRFNPSNIHANLPVLFGIAYSSLNLYYSYCSLINPIKPNQPVLLFFQACPLDQKSFNYADECNGVIDYCAGTGTYPVITFATNPNVFKRILFSYSSYPCNILHFSSHGTNGKLIFCTPGTYKSTFIQPNFVIDTFSKAMNKHNKLPLIYANSCYSDSFVRSFMLRRPDAPIVRRALGVMGTNNDYCANKFSLAFYNYLSSTKAKTTNLDDLPLLISNSFYMTKQTFENKEYSRKVCLMKRRKNR